MVNEVFGLGGRDRSGELAGVGPPKAVLDAEMADEDQAEDLDQERAAFASEVVRLELLIQKLDEKGQEHQDLITEVQASVAALPDPPAAGTVAGDRARQINFVWSRKRDEPYHSVASAHPMLGPEWHETRCGWTFGLTLGLKRSADPPEGARPCETCYPELRKARDQRKVPLPGGVAPSAGGTRN